MPYGAGMANGRPDMEHFSPDRQASELGKCTRCCCCLSIVVLVVIVTALGVALLFILFIKPTKPHFSLQSAQVQGFRVEKELRGFHDSAVYLSLNIALSFTASNPNRVGIDYSSTSLKCIYSGTLLGVALVPSFYQPAHSKTTVHAVISVDRLNVLQSMSLRLLKDATVNDNVPLNVTGPVGARIKIFGMDSPKVQFAINCLIVLSPRLQAIKSKECNVAQVILG